MTRTGREQKRAQTAPSWTSMPHSRVVMLPDGRQLGWLELGVPDGRPVVVAHGTPGSRLQMVPGDQAARAAGVRLLVPDRPGYGLSTSQSGRSILGWTEDLLQLLGFLGVDRFAVIGISGGAPYALACARQLPERVTAVGIVSGVAPLAAPGSETGMLASDRLLLRLGRRSPTLIRPLCAATAAFARRRPERVLELMGEELSPADAAVLRRPDVRAAFVADLVAPVRTVGATTALEYGLLTRDWGFGLHEVEAPVDLWHGGADREVPVAQARRLAALLPRAVLHELPQEGHLLVADRLEEILRTVTRESD